MNFPQMQLTQAGIDAVLDGVYGGAEIVFTSVKFGDGTAPADVRAATGLTHTVAPTAIASCTVADHLATIKTVFDNSSINTGFYLREIGVFAKVDDGEEFLYSYTNAGSNAGWVKPYAADNLVTLALDIVVAVGDAENVDAIISGAVGYVTTQDFEDFLENDFEAHIHNYNNPHRVTKEQVGLGNVPNLVPSNMTVSFTRAAALQNLVSGKKLTELFGMLSRAVYALIVHLQDSGNPHNTTPASIGAASADDFDAHIRDNGNPHRVSVSQLNSTAGILSIERGGTGEGTLEDAKAALNYTTTYYQDTLLASGWTQDGGYVISGYTGYNLEVSIANTATNHEQRVYSRARLTGDTQSNVLHALGRIPDIDIPIIIKAEEAGA